SDAGILDSTGMPPLAAGATRRRLVWVPSKSASPSRYPATIGLGPRVADRIAHHVLDGAVQQLGIARHAGVAGLGDLHGPAAALGLEHRFLHVIVVDRDETDCLAQYVGDLVSLPGTQ